MSRQTSPAAWRVSGSTAWTSPSSTQRAGRLPGEHRDPFDRMLIAQAQIEDLAVVTNDPVFDGYSVTRLW
jgi:PIN domain nuclease of toxin-antitoxin system